MAQRTGSSNAFAAKLAAVVTTALIATAGTAQLPIEQTGRVVTLPAAQEHWAWVGDPLLRRSSLVDLDRGRLLGMVSGGFGLTVPLVSTQRGEIYLPETHYSRGSRGIRTDVLTVYNARTLAPVAEVGIPPKRAISTVPVHHAALTDDQRFALVFNLTPAASVSVVDLVERRFAGEIGTPGCSLVYPASNRRFAMLCIDGALLVIGLDERGGVASRRRTAPFFDPDRDPITEKGVRWGDRWLFASFEGRLHEVDLSGEEPVFAEPWPLVGEEDARAGWRVGGAQHLAIHEASGRLYALMHQGEADSHKEPGTEIWVYEERRRVQRIESENPGVTFLGVPIQAPRSWVRPVASIVNGLIDWAGAGMGFDEIQVTQDEHPLLVGSSSFVGGLALYDARTGEFLRRIYSGNATNMSVQAPYGSPSRAGAGTPPGTAGGAPGGGHKP